MRLMPVTGLLLLAACGAPQAEAPADPPSDGDTAAAPARVEGLPEPAVTMTADPPPPYTYWAPEGSEVRNHPSNPNVWVAFGPGSTVAYYFGDACEAAAKQTWIGRARSDLPEPPTGAEWRIVESGESVVQDLQLDRLNIEIDPQTLQVISISCR